MEKTRKHDDSLFMMFVDLKKAYYSVPKEEVLWCTSYDVFVIFMRGCRLELG